MADARKPELKEPPQIIVDAQTRASYQRGAFLGKGGFARVYTLTNRETNEVVAGKVISKTLLVKSYQREKMSQEVRIHRNLSHENVVKLLHYFEDRENVYVLLELCPRRSLMELHKRRKAVTEPEARFFTHQVSKGIEYLHAQKVVHRDLKLGNLFLNADLHVKIGDFGLATVIETDGERKRTLCGTPNYIAPEVLDKKGHSFEVDVWAIGCILYTLLFGKPPFETKTLKDTYQRIKLNQYHIPSTAPVAAANLIKHLLAAEPSKRPNVAQVLTHEFFRGFMPARLPTSCLTMAPKFDHRQLEQFAKPRGSVPSPGRNVLGNQQIMREQMPTSGRPSTDPMESGSKGQRGGIMQDKDSLDRYLEDLYQQITAAINSNIKEIEYFTEDDESPEAMPIFWISKWVDYSDKYGIGYQLSDNSVGVLFNDCSKMVLDMAGNELTYLEKDEKEHYFDMESFPETLTKKVTLLKYFRSYMNEHLLKAGANAPRQEGDDLARLPVLRYWFRTRSAIVLHLSNGTLQINFFEDHTKMIICPLMSAVSYIDEHKQFHVLKLSNIEKYGCTKSLLARLKYSKTMVERLLNQANSGTAGSSTHRSRSASVSAMGTMASRV